MTKEDIYERMITQYVTPDTDIPCEFDEGKPCMELYAKVCDARLSLAARTGIDFEDRDVLTILESMEEIAKRCALKMYDYGAKYGHS